VRLATLCGGVNQVREVSATRRLWHKVNSRQTATWRRRPTNSLGWLNVHRPQLCRE